MNFEVGAGGARVTEHLSRRHERAMREGGYRLTTHPRHSSNLDIHIHTNLSGKCILSVIRRCGSILDIFPPSSDYQHDLSSCYKDGNKDLDTSACITLACSIPGALEFRDSADETSRNNSSLESSHPKSRGYQQT
jgi:hypothetical protein